MIIINCINWLEPCEPTNFICNINNIMSYQCFPFIGTRALSGNDVSVSCLVKPTVNDNWKPMHNRSSFDQAVFLLPIPKLRRTSLEDFKSCRYLNDFTDSFLSKSGKINRLPSFKNCFSFVTCRTRR